MTLATVIDSRADLRGAQRITRQSAARRLNNYPFLIRKAVATAALIEKGTLSIRMPDGAQFLIEGEEPGPRAELRIGSYDFARKFALGGEIGFAESFADGDWDTPDLAKFLELFCINRAAIVSGIRGPGIVKALRGAQHFLRRNTKRGARRNIYAHYDIGNEFYESWLDETMAYSSAVFASPSQPLVDAQKRKFELLASRLRLTPASHLLEIGCGWGGFAIHAAQTYGCKVTALTISPSQFDYARRRAFESGLADQIEFKLQDYRDEDGVYDAVASIEMIEAVGESYWPLWFNVVRHRLREGGRLAMQAITIDEELFPDYRRNVDFIRHYIFPGGMLPTGAILRELGRQTGFALTEERAFGQDYARTLAMWRDRFLSAWGRLAAMGFDERFERIWRYYLAYCEAGFRAGAIDARHLIFSARG